MLYANKALLRHVGDDLTVDNEGCAAVVANMNTENVHFFDWFVAGRVWKYKSS
jgi:hypothetical protein